MLLPRNPARCGAVRGAVPRNPARCAEKPRWSADADADPRRRQGLRPEPGIRSLETGARKHRLTRPGQTVFNNRDFRVVPAGATTSGSVLLSARPTAPGPPATECCAARLTGQSTARRKEVAMRMPSVLVRGLIGLAAALMLTTTGAAAMPGREAPEAAPAGERVIAVPGSAIRLALWEERQADGSPMRMCGISLDGLSFVRVAPVSYILGFRYEQFDPLAREPEVDPLLVAAGDGRLQVVQFVSQPLEIYSTQIASLGGEVRHYIPQCALLVEMDPAVAREVRALPYVRWVGPYHPAYRLEEFLFRNTSRAAEVYPLMRYNIEVMEPPQKAVVADRIRGMGGVVDRADAGKVLIEATLTPAQLFEIVRWDEVLFVDRWGPYTDDMDIVREISGANYIETVAGFTGQGVRGEIFDCGLNYSHHDFESRPLIFHTTCDVQWHGSCTTGICFGDGSGNAQARGLLPDGQGIVADYDVVGLTGQSRYDHDAELLGEPYWAVFQSASCGSVPWTTTYTTISADTDQMIFDHDLVHTQSQSNTGNQSSRPQAWAKNVIACGGIYHYGTLDRSDDRWNGGASIGPASDGRIKPNLSHFYDGVYTVGCCAYLSYEPGFYGTSCSTAIIGGHVGLFFQMWAAGIFGNEVIPGGTVFENRCHAATARALLINSAYQYDFTGLTHDLTRTHQGWGMPDLANLYDLRDRLYIVDETDVLAPFAVARHPIPVGPDEPALKVTMVYADPPGNPAVQSQHRVNDLSLAVISPGGMIYYGNQGLYEGVWSVPGGSPDTKNTEECVYVQMPQPGIWVVEVHADEIIQDGHVETPELDCDYALVVSGVDQGGWGRVANSRAPRADLALELAGPARAASGTRILFRVPAADHARLTVHDLEGRLLATLVDGPVDPGEHHVVWQGAQAGAQRVRPGVYFLRLAWRDRVATRKLLIAD
jgi:hypothetical protein